MDQPTQQQCHPSRHSASKAKKEGVHPYSALICFSGPGSFPLVIVFVLIYQDELRQPSGGVSGANLFDCCSHVFVRSAIYREGD